jgi:diguanylate cyclase (GGDEF)-like protein/putative nucleotidyltransferase with HDIG domain
MQFRKLPLFSQIYILVNVLLSGGLLLRTLAAQGIQPDLTFGLLVALAVLTNIPKVHLTITNGRMTLSNTVIFLAIMLRGSGEAMAVAGLSAFAGTVFIKRAPRPDGSLPPRTWYKPAFSTSNLVQSAAAAAALWHFAWPYPNTDPLKITLPFLVALLLMTAAYYFVNTIGVSLAVTLSQRLNLFNVWKENFLWTFPGYLCAMSAAAGSALVCIHPAIKAAHLVSDMPQLGLGSLLLLPPVYVVFYSYKLYLEKINTELRHVKELNELNERVISTLSMTIEAKDRYTHKHVERVREFALGIAREMGVTGPDLEAVRIGAMVHDIGKIAIPESILTKPGKLTPEEFERMETHVMTGVRILEAVNFPFPVEDAVVAHHERWDGNGYPYGLKGEEIPLIGRIVALADGFDALTTDRHYRKAMTEEEALELIFASSGKQYDPKVIDALIRCLPSVRPIIAELNQHEMSPDQASQRRMIPQEALEEIARAAEEAFVLSEISLQPNQSHDPQEVIDLLLEKAMLLLPATSAAVFLLDEDAQEVQLRGCAGMYGNLFENLTMKVGEGISGWVVAHGQTALNVPAVNDLARRVTPGENLELSSTLSVPLQIGGTCIGAISLYHTGYNLYHSHHQRLLITLADHASSTLDTLSRLETNQLLAHTDSLTDLPNMRFLIQHLEDLTAESQQPFSILMLDLNRFKQINDSMGHLEGDRVLQETANLLRNSLRKEDLVARYAGDEFVVICHSPDPKDAYKIAERISEQLGSYQIGDGECCLSASMGIASYPYDGSDWRTLVSVADRRMYSDKLNYHCPEKSDRQPSSSRRSGSFAV